MPRMALYMEQHAEIMQLAGELERLLEPESLGAAPAPAHQVLSKLSGKLSVHLAAEDRLLYPQLMNCTDPATQSMSKRFLEEMGPISKAFRAYAVRWGMQRTIQSEPDAFITETKAILAAVAKRIRRENRELYPLAEKL